MTASSAAVSMPAISSIGQIAIVVADLPRAKHFYAEQLGLTPLFDAGPHLSFLQCGDIRIMLDQAASSTLGAAGGSILYFRVADINDAYARLQSRGVTFADTPHLIARMPDHELWMAHFHDPDGHMLALMCEHRSSTSRI